MGIWRVVEVAPNYSITAKGIVKNTITGRFPKISHSGDYPIVNLNNNGHVFQKGVHILVATAFVRGKAPGLIVNHKDGNKSNYLWWNLEWITHKENSEHAVRTGLIRNLRAWVDIDGVLVEIDRKTVVK